MIAAVATQELGLALEVIQITPTRVETVQTTYCHQIMEGRTSEPWDTSWFSDILKQLNITLFFLLKALVRKRHAMSETILVFINAWCSSVCNTIKLGDATFQLTCVQKETVKTEIWKSQSFCNLLMWHVIFLTCSFLVKNYAFYDIMLFSVNYFFSIAAAAPTFLFSISRNRSLSELSLEL